MRYSWFVAGVAALGCGLAAPAIADGTCEGGMCALPAVSAAPAAPSAREIQSAVDAYLAPSKSDATLVGGPGQAGYDGGFWIRGGSFLLKINLTIQTRFEYFDWDDTDDEPAPGGDLSGFSLPRVTLKLSGDVTCDIHYYAELEFGHVGHWFDNDNIDDSDGANTSSRTGSGTSTPKRRSSSTATTSASPARRGSSTRRLPRSRSGWVSSRRRRPAS